MKEGGYFDAQFQRCKVTIRQARWFGRLRRKDSDGRVRVEPGSGQRGWAESGLITSPLMRAVCPTTPAARMPYWVGLRLSSTMNFQP